MEHDLVAFVGSGLQVLASGPVGQPPAGSVYRGYEFIDHLLLFGDSGLDKLVVDAVASIWHEWRLSGLPRAAAFDHFNAMPDLLEEFRPDPAAVCAVLGDSKSDGSYKLASLVVGKAEAAGCFDDLHLNRSLSFFFIERLFAVCLERSDTLLDLAPAIIAYFERFEDARADMADANRIEPPVADSRDWHDAGVTAAA